MRPGHCWGNGDHTYKKQPGEHWHPKFCEQSGQADWDEAFGIEGHAGRVGKF